MNHISLEIAQFCAEECARQKSGELSVYHMIAAYDSAVTCYTSNTKQVAPWVVLYLGKLVDPTMASKYRSIPVTLDNFKVPFETIDRNIQTLCSLNSEDDYNHVTAKEFYFYFERIHPFLDGNGRVGAILYNWINGTLFHPVTPPEVF